LCNSRPWVRLKKMICVFWRQQRFVPSLDVAI
jgi:hypothetical protein